MLLNEELRQARSGPMPVRKRRKRPIGSATRLKKGAPTVTLLPCTYSEMMGNTVPHRTGKQAAKKTWLFKRKPDPRPRSPPPQAGVGPLRAQEDAAGEKKPRHHGPAAGDVDPLFSRVAHHECAESKCERHAEAHVAEGKN